MFDILPSDKSAGSIDELCSIHIAHGQIAGPASQVVQHGRFETVPRPIGLIQRDGDGHFRAQRVAGWQAGDGKRAGTTVYRKRTIWQRLGERCSLHPDAREKIPQGPWS